MYNKCPKDFISFEVFEFLIFDYYTVEMAMVYVCIINTVLVLNKLYITVYTLSSNIFHSWCNQIFICTG